MKAQTTHKPAVTLSALGTSWRGVLAFSFLLGLSAASWAQSVRLFGPPERGTARPPLWMNLRPNSATDPTAPPYTPAQVRKAYGFDQLTANGAGQIIAIVDAYDDSKFVQNDLNKFCAQWGIPSTTVHIATPQGKPAGNTGWQQEESLDVQWAHAIAPGATIWLVEAANNSDANLFGAVDYAVNRLGATVVSMSWGGSDSSSDSSLDSHFTAPRVTFVASSGDSGEGSSVEYPAASPYVLAVGGTTLLLNSSGGYGSESAWSGSGGGISLYEPAPSWQANWAWWSPKGRGVPDVAYLADPNYGVYVVYRGNWYEFGGTSVGAPQWAAFTALCNQMRAAAGKAPLGGALYVDLYSIAGSLGYSYFNDTTSGSNGADPDDSAGQGYDLVTGIGSPVANLLSGALQNY